MLRIGILGGTFNPIHLGHLILAEEAYRILGLNKVIFVPCYLPPHKSYRGLISAQHRLAMIKEAIKGNNHFTVSDIELREKEISYTFKTLQKFRRIFPRYTKIFLIVGSDAIRELTHWKNFKTIIEMSKIIIAKRTNFPVDKKPHWARIIKIPQIEISSSEIRSRIKKEITISYLVPCAVEKYIEKNRLYRNA
ncbi:MAG: nicotinate-nucleotide adenylyltransferase [Candidatus Omnitrophica bacterium]|nr:nicotinate-nucleotide adenylyltransferase [Candidatus Omnitrophota bacterium]